MKFLPVNEFEKRQKSINFNRAIMNSAKTKIGYQTGIKSSHKFVQGLKIIQYNSIIPSSRNQMWSIKRGKQSNWKMMGLLLSRKRNMKLQKSFILKALKWISIRDHFGQTEPFAETEWENMKMLWSTVYRHSQLIQNALRRGFQTDARQMAL